jgi:hypothetical protein
MELNTETVAAILTKEGYHWNNPILYLSDDNNYKGKDGRNIFEFFDILIGILKSNGFHFKKSNDDIVLDDIKIDKSQKQFSIEKDELENFITYDIIPALEKNIYNPIAE